MGALAAARAAPAAASAAAAAAAVAHVNDDDDDEQAKGAEEGGAKSVATKSDYVMVAKNWFADPQFHGKALLLRPRSNSNTPDVFFYVPESALRLLPDAPMGTVLRPVLIQEQVKGVVDLETGTAFTAGTLKKEVAKALKGDALAEFDNVFLVLADKLGALLKSGPQTPLVPNMYIIIAEPEEFLRVAPRRPITDYH